MNDQLYAVLIAVEGDLLLLPNAAVAEVLSIDRLEAVGHIAPIWLAGWCDFGGARLPAVRFEVFNGAPVPGHTRRARVAVINSFGSRFGLLTQGYPHLVTLNRTAIEPVPLRDSDRPDRVLSRVRIARQMALVPDLAAIEREIRSVLEREPAAAAREPELAR